MDPVADRHQQCASPPVTAKDRDSHIRRQVAIKTATRLVGAFPLMREEVRVEHIFPLANRILGWLENGSETADSSLGAVDLPQCGRKPRIPLSIAIPTITYDYWNGMRSPATVCRIPLSQP